MALYRLSFTAADLMTLECKALAEQFCATPGWGVVANTARTTNLLNKTRSTSSIRQIRELILRLSKLSPQQVTALPSLSSGARASICFLSVLKAYDFIKDFMLEVICPKWTQLEEILRPSEFFDFYTSKAISHPELNSISELTVNKLRQVIFRMLEQTGFLGSSRSGVLLPVHHDPEFVELIKFENESFKRCFGV